MENKLVNLRYVRYISAKFHKNIPSSCWDQFTSSEIDPNSCYVKIDSFFAILQNFSATTPVKFNIA